jgi:hypothetical protein
MLRPPSLISPALIAAVLVVGGGEIRAAANASRGAFAEAVGAQTQAIAAATTLGWDLNALRNRLALYSAHQSWSGDLLAF